MELMERNLCDWEEVEIKRNLSLVQVGKDDGTEKYIRLLQSYEGVRLMLG